MKKILILIMTLSLLTACSSSASSDSQTDSQTTEESSAVYKEYFDDICEIINSIKPA